MQNALLTLRAIPTLLRVGFVEILAYRAEMIIWVLSATLPLVMLGLWNSAAENGPVGGYDQLDFARYFLVTLVVRHLTSVWLCWELNNLIRTGELSPWLLRPVSYLWWNLAETVAAWPMRLVVLAPLIVGMVWVWPEAVPELSVQSLVLGAISIALGLGIQFLIQCIFGLLSFWLDQSLGLYQAWFVLWGILGGYMVPQALLPQSLQILTAYLPFRATLGIPVELILGQTGPGALGVQVVWLVILTGITRKIWQAGITRYGAFGA